LWRSTIRLQIDKPIPLPRILGLGVKSLENAKDAFGVFRLNSNAVVADRKPPFVLPSLG
jgi:hypothetical protein